MKRRYKAALLVLIGSLLAAWFTLEYRLMSAEEARYQKQMLRIELIELQTPRSAEQTKLEEQLRAVFGAELEKTAALAAAATKKSPESKQLQGFPFNRELNAFADDVIAQTKLEQAIDRALRPQLSFVAGCLLDGDAFTIAPATLQFTSGSPPTLSLAESTRAPKAPGKTAECLERVRDTITWPVFDTPQQAKITLIPLRGA